MANEKRRSIRVKVRQLLDLVQISGKYQVIKEEANSSLKNITIIDISCGGICIEIVKKLIIGSKLELTILPTGNLPKSTVECEVTRSIISSSFSHYDSFEVGLKYNSPNTAYLKNLYEFLKNCQN